MPSSLKTLKVKESLASFTDTPMENPEQLPCSLNIFRRKFFSFSRCFDRKHFYTDLYEEVMLTVKWIRKKEKENTEKFFFSFIKPHKFKSELKFSKKLYNRGKPISFSACKISPYMLMLMSDEAAGWEKGRKDDMLSLHSE